jgi:hypothetical protein
MLSPEASSRGDRACPERAGRRQPADRRLRDAVGAGKIGLHSALCKPPGEFLPLVCG